jgi:hypothetical protein
VPIVRMIGAMFAVVDLQKVVGVHGGVVLKEGQGLTKQEQRELVLERVDGEGEKSEWNRVIICGMYRM